MPKIITIEYVREFINSTEYTLLTTVYINAHSKLKVICNKNHEYEVNWNNFKSGQRCPICAISNRSGKNNYGWKGGVRKLNIPLFNTYATQISFCEEVRRDPENTDWLQVRCTESNCNKWFRPDLQIVWDRIKSINGRKIRGENRFYCSEECKKNCSIYNQVKYTKNNKPYQSRSSQADWRELVLERDEYQCVKCNSKENLIAHHIEGLNQNPLMSADIDLGITFCKKCNKEAHSEIGCRPSDMKVVNC